MTQLNTAEEKQTLLELADNMAAAATTFSGQGYGAFLEAREKYVGEVNTFLDKVQALKTK